MPDDPAGERRALKWLALALVVASAVLVWPFASWIILAVWTGVLARRFHRPLSRRFGDRPRLAAVLTLLLLALLVVPAVVFGTLLVSDAIALGRRLLATDRAQEVLRQLVSGDEHNGSSPDLVAIVMHQSERAWAIAQQLAGTAMATVIGLVIWIAGTYAILVDGARGYAWLEDHVPISAPALGRLASAFDETGRGLLVGSVGASLAQGIVATVIYVALGVPEPFVLGLLTFVFSVVPAVGTAMVWVPVAAGLALTDRTGAAVVLLLTGFLLIGTVDNMVRPYLTRRGHLQLPTFVVLVAMFGGIVIMGAWGVLVAPLVVRLAKEALAILRDQRTSA